MQRSCYFTGTADLRNVEFDFMGQRGYTENDDPRFTVSFVSTREASTDRPAYVSGCSFHNSYSTNIGVFDASRVTIHNNVMAQSYESCKLKVYNEKICFNIFLSTSKCNIL